MTNVDIAVPAGARPAIAPTDPTTTVRWGGAILLGVLGFFGNLASIPLAFDVDFIMGGTLAVVALRLFGTWPGIVAALIAYSATYVLWEHPWAIPALTLEIVAIACLYRWKRIPVTACSALYWAVLGIPLAFLIYRTVLGLDDITAFLIAIKQALNGLTQVTVGAVIIMTLKGLGLPRWLRAELMSIRNIVFVLLVLFASLPVILMTTTNARFHFDALLHDVKGQISLALAHSNERISEYRETIVNGVLETRRDDHALRDFMVARRISRVRYDSAGPGGDIAIGRSGAGSVHLVRRQDVVAESGQRGQLDIWVQTSALESRLDDPVARHLGALALLIGGEVVARGPAAPDVPTRGAVAERIGIDGRISILLPELPGKARMQRWHAADVEGYSPIAADPDISLWGRLPLAGAIRGYQEGLLEQLGLSLIILLILPLVAFPVSAHVTKGLKSLVSRFRELPRDSSLRSPCALRNSGIREFAALASEFDAMAQTLRYRQEEMRLYRKRLEQMMAQAPGLIYALRIEDGKPGAASYVSPSSVRLIGYAPEECMAANWWLDNVHPDDRSRAIAANETLMREGEVQHTYRFRHRDGDYIWLHDDIHMVRDADGNAIEAVGCWTDYTAQRAAEQKMIQTAKMADLGQMATGMAHELNQPLNIIDLATANLANRIEKGNCDPDYAREKVARVRQQVARASQIIDHMRIFGRMDSGQPSPFNPAEAVDSIALLMAHQLGLDDIDLDITNDAPNAMVLGQPGPLEQVLLNLVTNARQQIGRRNADEGFAKGQKRDRISIVLSIPGDGKNLVIEVSDSGGGVPDAIMPRIFEPFMTTKPVGEGTGLGLPLVYGIVHDMGGDISVCNEASGAKFSIRLPLITEPVA